MVRKTCCFAQGNRDTGKITSGNKKHRNTPLGLHQHDMYISLDSAVTIGEQDYTIRVMEIWGYQPQLILNATCGCWLHHCWEVRLCR